MSTDKEYEGIVRVPFKVTALDQSEAISKALESARKDLVDPLFSIDADSDGLEITVVG
jgi:hypothetical protein